MKDGYEDQGKNSRSKDSEEFAEERSITSRQRARSQLSSDVEEFLAGGGAISEVDPEVTADPRANRSQNTAAALSNLSGRCCSSSRRSDSWPNPSQPLRAFTD
ncbi:hypothetical protein QT397_04320 [Microbulbifer sp. MKSA007]|nr:hypothetical protein QT397_04320 [Microbulbifer sp. MKSA007]